MKCTHFFCTMPARAGREYTAKYKVEQTFPNGYVMVTYACEGDFEEMRKVLLDNAVVTRLDGE